MRLIVTRAAEDSARTLKALEAMGHSAIASPVIEFASLPTRWPTGVVDAVMATSRQAFALLVDGPSPETRRTVPLFLVGERTAESARAAGFTGSSTIAPNAATLAAIYARLPERPGRLVYVAGRDRKPDLERALASIGPLPRIIESYVARPVAEMTSRAADALRTRQIDGVLHFSRRSAELFVEQVRAAACDIASLRHYCLSKDVAESLPPTCCNVAASPDEKALLDLLPLEECERGTRLGG